MLPEWIDYVFLGTGAVAVFLLLAGIISLSAIWAYEKVLDLYLAAKGARVLWFQMRKFKYHFITWLGDVAKNPDEYDFSDHDKDIIRKLWVSTGED